MFLISVNGEIIANDKKHYAQNWACKSIGSSIKDYSYDYDQRRHIVNGNLVLNKNIRAVPYAVYATEKGICAVSPGNLYAAPGAMAAELCYKDNISEIESLLERQIPSEIEVFFYNGLLTGVFSVLELFLSDVLLCLIFSNSGVYNRALEYMTNHKKEKTTGLETDLSMQEYFTKDIVYHKFNMVDSMFKQILKFSIPNTKNIEEYLHKRNNITHRYAFSNIDRMRMTIIDSYVLKKFITYCNVFVENIMNDINHVYYNNV